MLKVFLQFNTVPIFIIVYLVHLIYLCYLHGPKDI